MPRTRGAQYLSVPYRATKIKRKVTKTMWTHVSFEVCPMCQNGMWAFCAAGGATCHFARQDSCFFLPNTM